MFIVRNNVEWKKKLINLSHTHTLLRFPLSFKIGFVFFFFCYNCILLVHKFHNFFCLSCYIIKNFCNLLYYLQVCNSESDVNLLSVSLLDLVHLLPTSWPLVDMNGVGRIQILETIQKAICLPTMRKYKCCCQIVSLDSSWYHHRDLGITTSWVSILFIYFCYILIVCFLSFYIFMYLQYLHAFFSWIYW